MTVDELSGDFEFFLGDRVLPVPYACARYVATLYQLAQFHSNPEHDSATLTKVAESKLFIGWCFLVADAVHAWMLLPKTDATPRRPTLPSPPETFRYMQDFPGNDNTLWDNIDWTSLQSINDGLFPGRRAPMKLIDVRHCPNGHAQRPTDDIKHWAELFAE